MKKGYIIKLIAGQYTVVDKESKEVFVATARGKLRAMRLTEDNEFLRQVGNKTKKDIKIQAVSPKVGDNVLYQTFEEQTLIMEVLPRKNELIRPDVANIDQVLLVFSCVKPDFSFHLLDKFLVILAQNNLVPVLVVSKIDLISEEQLSELKKQLEYYTKYYDIYYVNSKQRIGIDTLEHIFKDKLTVLAGQTGVGKSTLVNALIPELNLKTQEISKALGRGKHTTRHSQLYRFADGYLADTPGFSKIELDFKDYREIRLHYPDFLEHQEECKFSNQCLHISEPGCAVKNAVTSGLIPEERYQNYLQFVLEIQNKKVKY